MTPGRERLLKGSHKGYKISFLLIGELEFKDQVEELYRILQCQKPSIMKVRWRVLDAPQREGLDRTIC
jgi:hypothetical protein